MPEVTKKSAGPQPCRHLRSCSIRLELMITAVFTGLFKLIAPMTVGTLVSAIDPSPQGLLSLVAFLSNKISSPSASSLPAQTPNA